MSGQILAGYLIRAACQRHLDNLESSEKDDYPFYFDEDTAGKVLGFSRLLYHHEGPLSGKPFDPDPFQAFILCSIFAWKRKADHLRRFRYAYVEVPRKNGKTFLASVVSLYMLSIDGEGGAQVYSAATKREQAKIAWEGARRFAKRSPALIGKFRERYSSLEFEPLDARFEPLPADSDKLDGLNPHCVVNDELHAWPDRGLWDVIEDGLGARSQPLIFSITTAGYNMVSICYEIRTHCVHLLEMEGYEDEKTFAFIACPDPGEDDPEGDAWKTPEVWQKANPALGTAKGLEYMEDQVEKAQQMPSKQFAVLNKQLNIWTAGEEKWLDVRRFEECGRVKFESYEEAFDSLKGRECYSALDLSSKVDFSALVHLFPPVEDDDVWSVLARLWLPEKTLRDRERTDRAPIRSWAHQGFITGTDGEIIDYEQIFEEIKQDGDRFQIREIGFDPWNAVQLATNLDVEGFDMVQMRQGFGTLAAPTKELEAMVLRRQFEHFGNPVLCWMARNTIVKRDVNDNLRPDKEKSTERIDGIVALIMALGRAIVGEEQRKSVYETRGVRFL